MKLGKTIDLAIAATLGFVGALGFVLVTLSEFRPEYNVGNLIQASSTIAAAMVVAAFIQKRTQLDLKLKELLIGQLEIVGSELEGLGQIDFKGGRNYPSVVSDLKKIGMIFKGFEEAAKKLGFSKEVCDAVDFSEDMVILRKLATDTDNPVRVLAKNAKKCAAVVKDNILKLDEQRATEILNHITDMRTKTLNAQMSILSA